MATTCTKTRLSSISWGFRRSIETLCVRSRKKADRENSSLFEAVKNLARKRAKEGESAQNYSPSQFLRRKVDLACKTLNCISKSFAFFGEIPSAPPRRNVP